MPKSRREKPVALTKTKKHGQVRKDRLMSAVRECVSIYPLAFVFELQSMRNVKFKELREQWAGSRFFLGKNRVMQVALGRMKDEEQREGISKLTPYVTGHRGLLFTDTSKAEVLDFFSSFSHPHYARSGCVAPRSFTLSAGPLPSDIAPHPLEPTLRKLGLPTRLQQSVVQLLSDVVVCREGDVLTPEQCRLLQIFQQQMAVMRVRMVAVWEAETGEVEEIADERPAADDGESAAAAGMEAEAAGAEAEGDDADEQDDDDCDEFSPEPYKDWGEVAVPTTAR